MSESISRKILSDIVVYSKYARYVSSKKRREKWEETVLRNAEMHVAKFPHLSDEIYNTYQYVLNRQVLPSMRSLQFGGKPIEISPNRLFNCFKQDTRFITSVGVKSFEDFSDGDKTIVLTHQANWEKAVVKCYGKQKLNKITFHRGRSEKSVYATAEHRWIMFDGEFTSDLSIGDVLYPAESDDTTFNYDDAEPMEKLYWCYGFIYGDDTLVKSKDKTYSMVRLCGDDVKYLPRFKEMGFSSSEPTSCEGDVVVYIGKYNKTAPDLTKDSLSMIKSFLDGYLSADAYKNPDWYQNNQLSKYKDIQASDSEHINFLKSALETCGYFITNIKDLTGEETNFGIRPETYKFSITNRIGSRKNTSWVVSNIEETDLYENVWCLEVEHDHSFILSGGIVTGNCAYMPLDHPAAFSETMFLLLGGTGVGYSVQKHHVEKLPEILGPKTKSRRYLIGDSIEGWADAIKVLVEAYFSNKSDPIFDYRDIRPKGALLITSGGKAPGPQPLKDCLHNIRKVFDRALERGAGVQLSTLEVHDIICYIADAVLAGGIRRAALIALFSFNDEDMLTCKFGNWSELNPQRARANNSAVALRHRIKKKDFFEFWEKVKASGCGEPGIYFTNDKEWGANPCVEIGLRPNQFCNLTTVNVSDVESQEDLNTRVRAAAFIATLQASYTDFHYLRDIWKRTTEKEALIGVSMTGIASGAVLNFSLEEAAEEVKKENARVAKLIDINPAARTTCVKPEGTASLVVGSSSGIHAWHAPYYIRRMRLGKNESIYKYLKTVIPELLEDEVLKPELESVLSIPVKSPEGSIFRDESALELLERGKLFSTKWVTPGHISGSNKHNVSITVSVKDYEWDSVGVWMWENRHYYNGISVLPYDGGNYIQAPFEECTQEVYETLLSKCRAIDLSQVIEDDDLTSLKEEAACAGGNCTINKI